MNFMGGTETSNVISMSDWEREETKRRRRGEDDAFSLEETSESGDTEKSYLINRKKRNSIPAKYTNSSDYTSSEEVGFLSARKHKKPNNSRSGSYNKANGTGGYQNKGLGILDGTKDEITLSWNNVNVFLPNDEGTCCRSRGPKFVKHILKDVSGIVHPGTLLAVMGASGAGKSTLLNVLTYRNRGKLKVTGDVRVNGQRVGEGMTSVSAYVQQDDLFIGTLKVREHLWFQAMLRMDSHISYQKRMERIEAVLLELGLMKCAENFIGIPGRTKGISGGEMKRLSFASEVLTDPPLMYCDEPTSGLDSFMAQNVITTLRSMAEKGKTIVCTIHQPSSEVYELFDRLLLMAEGRVAYLGPANQTHAFFKQNGYPCPSNYNPADFFVHTLAIAPGSEEECRRKVDKFCNNYETAEQFNEVMDEIEGVTSSALTEGDFLIEDDEEAFSDRSRYKASFWWQLYAVFWRSWVGTYRDVYVFNTRLIQTLVVSLIIGLLFMGTKSTDELGVASLNGYIFYTLMNNTYNNVFAIIDVFPTEMPLYFRDYSNGMYRPIVYFTCKSLAELPIFVLLPVIFVSVSYWMVGMYPDAGKFLVCVSTVIIVANTAVSFGYMISTCSSTVKIAMSIAPPLTIPLMLFGGFFLNSGSIPVFLEWLKYLSWFQYANEILVINQWDQVTNITCSQTINGTTSTLCYDSGDDVIASLNFDKNNFGLDFLYLFCLMFGYRLIAFLALLIRTKRHN